MPTLTNIPALDEQHAYRLAQDGDARALDVLVQRFMPLARAVAGRYARSGEPLDDLVQVASVGLIKAIKRFDPDRGLAFSSFAVPTMAGELRRHFRDRGWAVRPPRGLQEAAMQAAQSKEIVRRFIDEYQTGADESAFAELLHPDVVDHSRPPGIAE